MAQPLPVDEIANRMQGNWRALRPLVSGVTQHPTIVIGKPTGNMLAALPTVVRQALAESVAPGSPPLQVVKYAEIVDGTVVKLIDDGSTIDETHALHLVVNVISQQGRSASSRTYQVAAVPTAGAAGPAAR
jgi:hypothetical protein